MHYDYTVLLFIEFVEFVDIVDNIMFRCFIVSLNAEVHVMLPCYRVTVLCQLFQEYNKSLQIFFQRLLSE